MRECDAIEFFETLWGGFLPVGSGRTPQIEMRYTERKSFDDGKICRIWEPVTRIAEWVAAGQRITASMPHNVHYSVCPKWDQNGLKSSVANTSALWADIDHVNLDAFRTVNLPRLERAEISPTMIVSSGWGIHVFWVINGTWEGDLADAEKWNRFLAWVNGGDQQASIISHTLRYPASYNCKALPYRRVVSYRIGNLYPAEVLKGRLERICEAYLAHSEHKDALAQILKPPSAKNGRSGGGRTASGSAGDKMAEDLAEKHGSDAVLAMMESWSGDCPVLWAALKEPRSVEYQSWLSLAAGLYQIFGDHNGLKLFHSLSALDPERYSETAVESLWDNVVTTDLNAFNCGRLPEARQCPSLSQGKCKNLMSLLRRKVFSAARSDKRFC